jgi:large subunit ribosomal protein L5
MILDFKSLYKQKIRGSLRLEFRYKHSEQIPKLVKISINRGIGAAAKNVKDLTSSVGEVSLITGQRPIINKARKSISGFKIREGMSIGVSVTLRQKRMYNFLLKLIHIVLPRGGNFRGLKSTSFDGRGNYSLGVDEQLIFPEISYDDVKQLRGFDISIVTTAKTDGEARFLLTEFGMPFKKND